MKCRLINFKFSKALIIAFFAQAMPAWAYSMLAPAVKVYPVSGIAEHSVSNASIDGGVAFLFVLGLGYGVKRVIDLRFKTKHGDHPTDHLSEPHI